jgi:hypothetical protein
MISLERESERGWYCFTQLSIIVGEICNIKEDRRVTFVVAELHCGNSSIEMRVHVVYSKTSLIRPLNEEAWMSLTTGGSLLQIKSYAESFYESSLHYFRPAVSYHLSLRMSI